MYIISTTLGEFRAHYTARGLARLQFPDTRTNDPPSDSIAPTPAWLEQTTAALRAMLKGKAPARLPQLDLSRGTKMQQQLWRALLRIPFGHTRSYGELARALRRPKTARAIGQACGANPIPVLIPCHRVLASGGGLGGFSGGLDWKRRLLRIEGHPVPLNNC